jgi:hypothetical protein
LASAAIAFELARITAWAKLLRGFLSVGEWPVPSPIFSSGVVAKIKHHPSDQTAHLF